MRDHRKVYRGDRWPLDRPDHIRGLTRDAFPPAPTCYYRTLRCVQTMIFAPPRDRNVSVRIYHTPTSQGTAFFPHRLNAPVFLGVRRLRCLRIVG